MARRHYEGTTVSASQSLTAIDDLLRKHGVETVRWTSGTDVIRIEFVWPYEGTDLGFRIDLVIPKELDGYLLEGEYREKERRRRLRVLLNHIKAKLVAVEDGLVEMQQEFLPYLIGAGDKTLGELADHQLREGAPPNVRLLE